MLPFETRDDRPAWGRVQRPVQEIAAPRFRDEVERFASADQGPRLAVGLRRSYGDICLSSLGRVLDMAGLDRFIAFDAETGILRAEAGITLSQILRFAVPRGFFLAVTPGTRFVTLGGAIANDVHGKNHHRAGTFGCHVTRIGLVRGDRGLVEVGPGDGELFGATVGGLGLTGVILWAELRLARIASAMIDGEALPFDSFESFLAIARASEATHEFTVAWLDCARAAGEVTGVFFRGNWSAEGGLRAHEEGGLGLPFDAPAKLLNPLTLAAFNRLYRAVQTRGGPRRFRKHYRPFFYPLDGIGGWNRLYGRPGFFQYQCVVPYKAAAFAVPALARRITCSGQGSFLSVLKTFGERPSPGFLSVPRPGVTLALDFPNRGDETLALLSELDAILREAGGRLYPAKDGRIPPEMFRAGYPALDRFVRQIDPSMQSDFARRVFA
jgi:FAD/FMN-containing dehydrogenase